MARRIWVRHDNRQRDERRAATTRTVERSDKHHLSSEHRTDVSSVARRGLVPHSTLSSFNQATILQMQRSYGNVAVQRYLAKVDAAKTSNVAQRQVKPSSTTGSAAVGTDELKFKVDLKLSTDGKLKLDLGPAVDLRKFGLEAKGSYTPTKGWSGMAGLRLGDEKNHVTPSVTVDKEGKTTLELGSKFVLDTLTVGTKFATGKDKMTMAHTLGLKDPFGAEGFDVTASLHYRLDDPKVTEAAVAANLKLAGSEKDKTAPFLMLTIEGKYAAEGPVPEKKEAKGLILLRGHF